MTLIFLVLITYYYITWKLTCTHTHYFITIIYPYLFDNVQI
nr:MAG TPA: hypothetical protein [Caudoviricetes sp.]